MKKLENRHSIVIHGLITHHGTLRAKLCVRYLRKYLKHLYSKPRVKTYYDVDWIEYVKRVRIELGDKFRKLHQLKNPVIIFLDDIYIGDHRALIEYVTSRHGIIPDLPYPDLFPDFTAFLPKRNNKSYVYLDIRVGDLSDYVIGKMVFELHTDVVPETCRFFSYLCEPYGPYRFYEGERGFKYSYLGSSIRRIVWGSFIQGGVIAGGSHLRVQDESFTLKHDRRGVLSMANQGGNRSSTEFVISLKANPWMDGCNVVFGQLIFGESVLEAIEETPTYYQSPLKDILIVGCGVIPDQHLRKYIDFEVKLTKMKAKNITNVLETKRNKLDEIMRLEKKINDLLKKSEDERKCEFLFTDRSTDTEDLRDDTWISQWLEEHEQETSFREMEHIGEEQLMEEALEHEVVEEEEEEEIDEGFGLDYKMREKPSKEITKKSEDIIEPNELTLAEIIKKARRKERGLKTNMMAGFVYSILQRVFLLAKSEEDSTQLEDFEVPEIEDVIDIRDVPSGTLNEAFYEKGLYSLPKSLRVTLVEAYNSLSPSKLRLIGLEVRSVLKEGGIPADSLNVYSTEDFISGIVMAVVRVKSLEGGFFNDFKDIDTNTLHSQSLVSTLVDELCEDTVELLKLRGSNFLREALVEKGDEFKLNEEYKEIEEKSISELAKSEDLQGFINEIGDENGFEEGLLHLEGQLEEGLPEEDLKEDNFEESLKEDNNEESYAEIEQIAQN